MAIQIIFPSNIFCVCVIFLLLPAVCIEQSTFVVPISIDGFLLIYYQHAMDVWIFNLCTDELNVKTISEDCYHVRNLFVSVYIKMNGRKKMISSSIAVLKWNGRHEAERLDNEFCSIEKYFSNFISLIYGAPCEHYCPKLLKILSVCLLLQQNCYQLRQLLSHCTYFSSHLSF